MSSARLRRAPGVLLLHIRVAVLLMLLPVLLRFASVRRAVQLLTPRRDQARRPWSDVERIGWAVDRLYQRRLLRSYGPCLRRTLTLYCFLTRAGYPVTVTLGAHLDNDVLVAHAWLTLHGEPILEPSRVDRYAVMAQWGGGQWTVAPPADDRGVEELVST